MTTITRSLLGVSLGLSLVGCGGSSVPDHNGYPVNAKDPWTSAKRVSLDDNYEGKAEGTVNFGKRERARWFLLKLPADGTLEAKLTFEPISKNADLGFEILDAGFNIVAKGSDDEEGQPKKDRKVDDVQKGDTYLHVYTLSRRDAADFKIKIRYVPKVAADPRAVFPYNVPSSPELAAVPTTDDAPKKKKVVGKADPKPQPKPDPKPDVKPVATLPTGSIRASIVEFGDTGHGVHIILNKGSGAGVDTGWEGFIIAKATGRALAGSSFKVDKVKNEECDAVVRVSMDDVQNNRAVVLNPPK